MNIAIVGKMGSGKTTLAKHINQNLLNRGALISSFAAPIKDMYINRLLLYNQFLTKDSTFLESAFIPEFKAFKQRLDELDAELSLFPKGIKPRKHYQFIGEELKRIFGKYIWANKLFEDFDEYCLIQKKLNTPVKNFIIDDLRMTVEYETILNRHEDFIIIGIMLNNEDRINVIHNNKLGDESTLNDISEIEVDSIIYKIQSKNCKPMYQFENNRKLVINNPNYNLSQDRKKLLKFLIRTYNSIG